MTADDRLQTIKQIETMARDAWPAAQRDHLNGWQLRFTYGITRRANSVWPNDTDSETSLDEKLNDVELFYAVYEAPARFQVSPAVYPPDLDIVLAMRGYQRSAETAVQTAKLSGVLADTGPILPEPGFAVEVSEDFNLAWFQTYCDIEQYGARAVAVRRDIIQRIGTRTGFALARLGDEPVAVGLGVVSGDWLGIFSMATHAGMRRRGAGISILHALAGWAQSYGVRQAYLQVMLINPAALALYRRCGFTTLYHYHYREKLL